MDGKGDMCASCDHLPHVQLLCLPLSALAIWRYVRIGWWRLMPLLLPLVWMLMNPHLFPRPECTDNWTAQGVIGE